MNKLYKTIGVSKQAVYQYAKRQLIFDTNVSNLVTEAEELRYEHPGCGVEKMYDTLKPDFIGRDRFVDTMMDLGFRVKRRRNYKRTTISSKIYYPNLIKGMEVNRPSQIWQSDITYIPVGGKHYYAVFIIDVYTKKIVGYQVSDHMRATANVQALQMALSKHPPPEVHHSDRGSQYIYKDYISLLKKQGSQISMALSAQDNAYAERINRTIKEEYIDHWKPKTFSELKRFVKRAVIQYNNIRPHNNLEKRSPIEFEKQWSTMKDNNKPKLTIFNNEINV
ncbi:IS3 family transposase [Lutimonas sp.]|uniref:IS3 family transposase n=1 Tax=Lutimonas sp. TaxID=1872403 RepID=UPI003C730F00